jgi:hypothetical protein
MDTQDQKNDLNQQPRQRNRVWAGLFLLFVGAVFLLREVDYLFFPGWLFSWPMILIAVGIFTALKHGFRNPGWLVLLVIGTIFLLREIVPSLHADRFIVPAVIISVGLVLIFRARYPGNDDGWDNGCGRRNRNNRGRTDRPEQFSSYPPPPDTGNTTKSTNAFSSTQETSTSDTEEYINSTAILGGIHKTIISKNFRGGQLSFFMGGGEIDLSQADITGTVTLEVNAVMGGGKLILPPHWNIKSEITAIMAGIDDKRQRAVVTDPNKILILKGTVFMGGIEIRSY